MKKYQRNCPTCGNLLEYKTYRNWWAANKNKSSCISCCQKGKSPTNKIQIDRLVRVCKECGGEIIYTTRHAYLRAERVGGVCRKCTCRKFNSERKWSEESIAKIRNTKATNRIKDGTWKSWGNVNPVASDYLEKLNKSRGWNLKHAGNGGEQLICGYWIDGYDSEKNIVVEYDESYHYPYGKLRLRDVKRQSRIIAFLKCEFWRYNEKESALYRVN